MANIYKDWLNFKGAGLAIKQMHGFDTFFIYARPMPEMVLGSTHPLASWILKGEPGQGDFVLVRTKVNGVIRDVEPD